MDKQKTSTAEIPDLSGSALTVSAQRADELFLEGPRSRLDEFVTVLRVIRDFLRGFRVLHFVGPCVTVFGSARVKAGTPNYELARQVGAAVARLGIHSNDWRRSRHHGSGENRGAKDIGGRSVGCSIKLPVEQQSNSYLDRSVYWKELIDFINKMAEFGMISQADINLVYATDSVEEAIAHIKSRAIEPFGLKLMTRVRRSLPWLGEHGLVNKLANRSGAYSFGYKTSAPRRNEFHERSEKR